MDWLADDRGARQVAAIVKALKGADTLYLATDPDREGEAISWHVRAMLDEKGALRHVKVRRITFNEITRSAVRAAMAHPRDLDQPLIEAYLARRALDYLVGFTLSPVLWRKLPGSRSAGRVQSVALRLICEREAEIEVFRAREYWTVEAAFTTPAGAAFTARLTHLDGKQARPVRPARRGVGAAREGGRRGGQLSRRLGRAQARPPQPAAAVHHLDLAAGGEPQARLRRAGDDAARAAALRGRRHRRRDGRPDHLHAHRRRADGARGDRRHSRPCARELWRRLPAGCRARIHQPGEERAGSARGDPADRHFAHARKRGARPDARAAPALRTDLEARGREPDAVGGVRPGRRWRSPTPRARTARGCAPPARRWSSTGS